jgi:aspartate/glutamate racemase
MTNAKHIGIVAVSAEGAALCYRTKISRTSQKLATRGCDAIVLGCTEIPLLISETDSRLPSIDSTRTLARAALREAIVNCLPAVS